MKLISVNVEGLPLNGLGLPTRWHGNVALFNLSDSLLFLDYCAKEGYAVLGIEGFHVEKSSRTPDMGFIADFSSSIDHVNFASDSVLWSRKFFRLAENHPHLLFEFVLARK